MNSSGRLTTFVVTLGWLVFSCLSSSAADLRNVLVDHTITTWSTDDGLPAGVLQALAQDRNGHLWIGTEGGLAQFNGARFIPWDTADAQNPRRPVRVLCVTRDGSLWVGFGKSGGVTRMRGGETTRFGAAEGLPHASITALVEDAAGVLWAGTEAGLFSLAAERWAPWPSGQGLPDAAISGAFVDAQDNFYAGTATGVFRRAKGTARFEQIEYSSGAVYRPAGRDPHAGDRVTGETAANRDPATARSFPRSFAQDGVGHVLVNDWQSGFRLAGVPLQSLDSSVRGRGSRLLVDRRHSLWIATAGQGLWRVSLSPESRVVAAERMTALTGLVNDGVTALLEDTEGNIWAGVQEGLVRLAPRRIRQLTDYGLVIGVELTPDKNVWVGTLDELIRFSAERPESPSARVSLGNANLRVMHADHEGTLWVATDRGLSMMPSRSLDLTRVANTGTLERIELMESDGRGGLWLYDGERGLLHWSRGSLAPFAPPDALQSPRFVLLHADRASRLWVALADGRMAVIEGEATSVFGTADGLNVGTIRQVLEDDDGVVWLAGSEGLARFSGGRFVSLRSGQGFPFGDLVALAEDDVHDLWIGTGAGVLRISREDFESVAARGSEPLRYSLYNSQNGLAGHPHAYDSNRRVVRAGDGRLWFVTARGLSLIDPPLLREGRTAAHVRIDYVLVDEQRTDAAPFVSLPSRTSRVGIAYSQLNLSSPLRGRFRTRLEGFDKDWVPAGARLTAFYTNLPPRSYRFRVSAVNPDGTGVEPEAVWEFSIKPMFYQTSWFMVCSVLFVGAGLAGLWRLRLHQVRKQFSTIIGERVRLSRELHDTLLQNLVAIALQFDVVAGDAEASPGTRKRLVLARKEVEENIREARQMIFDLRSSQNHRRDLVTALRALGEHATADRRIEFELAVTGEVRACPARVQDELLRIGQEAVANAVRHASASHIRMALDFGPSGITLHVSDDGRGFDSAAPIDLESGHYGLTGMRERAQQIGAVLEVSSEPHKGTHIRAVVPLAA